MKSLQFDSLTNIAGLRHAITTRDGGVSQAEYSALNLAFHVGDDAKDVVENRMRLANVLGFDASTLVAAQQVHGANSQIVTSEYSGRGALDWDCALKETDALITSEKQLPLLILVADCAPILIVDPTRGVLAVVHAGWRGAVGKIASQTIAKMSAEFGTIAEEIQVGIGPCLCAACFEIGEEVAREVSSDCLIGGFEKPHLDLRALITEDLLAAGVLPSRIETMSHCPRCENQLLFSHRGQNGQAGRFGLVAWWE